MPFSLESHFRATPLVVLGWPFWLAVVGALVGSLLTTVIERLPKGEPFLRGRSRCPHCRQRLSARDLVPVVSFVLQRGRCRFCAETIPRWHLGVELAAIVLFLLAGLIGQPASTLDLLVVLALVSLLLALAVIDLRTLLLPDPLVAAATVLGMARSLLTGHPGLFGSISGGLLGLVLFGLLHVLPWRSGLRSPESGFRTAMGLGDVKLAGALGAVFGPAHLLVVLFLAFVAGGSVGAVLLALRRARLQSHLPFGPFLAGSAIGVLLFPRVAAVLLGLVGL